MSTGKFKSKAGANPPKNLGDHDPQLCNHRLNGQLIHHKPLKATEGKQMVKVYDTDGTRELVVPNRNPIEIPGIWSKSEFQRLKQRAHVVTLQDKMKMIEEEDRKKNQQLDEIEQRKLKLSKAQKQQKAVPGSKLDQVESEAKDKNLYLLRRSQELVTEQDQRVKIANGIILATKCRAIRNAQIAEKELIRKQLQEEENRLDMMMEQQRQKAIQKEEKKKQEEEQKKQRYIVEVSNQMKENEMERLLEAERIEEESKMLNKALIALQKDEEERLRKKEEDKKHIREEFRKANEEAQHIRTIQEEEQRMQDLRVKEFLRKKQEREDVLEKEAALVKAAKQREIARLQALQQKNLDTQAEVAEINALRQMEEKEREWRQSELEKAKKRKEVHEDLKLAREKQIEYIRKAQAITLARDEEDFLKVAKVQHELYEKEVEKKEKKRQEIIQHRKELLKQINEKERERINWQREKFEDGRAQRLEIEVKDRQVEEYMKQKINRLRENNVPEAYIKDIERQLKTNQDLI